MGRNHIRQQRIPKDPLSAECNQGCLKEHTYIRICEGVCQLVLPHAHDAFSNINPGWCYWRHILGFHIFPLIVICEHSAARVRAHLQLCVHNWKASANECRIYLRYPDWYHCIHSGTGLRQNENVGWKMTCQCVCFWFDPGAIQCNHICYKWNTHVCNRSRYFPLKESQLETRWPTSQTNIRYLDLISFNLSCHPSPVQRLFLQQDNSNCTFVAQSTFFFLVTVVICIYTSPLSPKTAPPAHPACRETNGATMLCTKSKDKHLF